MQLPVGVHRSQVCASNHTKKDFSSRTLVFYFPLCLTPAGRVLTSHVYKEKETTEIQMATCGMLQSYQTVLLYGKHKKKRRQVVRGQYVEGSKIRKTGRKGKKPKLGESKTWTTAWWNTLWICQIKNLREVTGNHWKCRAACDEKVKLYKVATKNVKSRMPVEDLPFVPHGFTAAG